MKIAVIHDWLTVYAGAEKVLEQILLLYPEADLFSLLDFLPDDSRGFILSKKAKTSFLQALPFASTKYRNYFPLMPLAVELLPVAGYDLVISSSHAFAKGVLTNKGQLHICYCHTPIRYAWDLYHQYLKESGLNKGIKGLFAKLALRYIRNWDASTAGRVNYFIANSRYIASRIKKIYGRDSTVIYPPVDIERFSLCTAKEGFYLTASRMVPYKKIGLIVEAFSRMPGRKLVVIGDGPEFHKVKRGAGKNIELAGYLSADSMKDYMQKAKAFVFAADEDFGIVPVEAQACGTPVIAYGKGGVLETVINGKTGMFFKDQTIESLINAVNDFEEKQDIFDYYEIRKNAEHFSKERFRKEFKEFVDKKVEEC